MNITLMLSIWTHPSPPPSTLHGQELEVHSRSDNRSEMITMLMLREHAHLSRPVSKGFLGISLIVFAFWLATVFASKNASPAHKWSARSTSQTGKKKTHCALEPARGKAYTYLLLHALLVTRQRTHQLQSTGCRVDGNGVCGSWVNVHVHVPPCATDPRPRQP